MYFKVSQLFAMPRNNYDYQTDRSVYGAIVNGIYSKTGRSILRYADDLHKTYAYSGVDFTGLIYYTYQQISNSTIAFHPSSNAEYMKIAKNTYILNLLADYILMKHWDDAIAFEDDENLRDFPSAEYVDGQLLFPVAQCVSDSAALVWDRIVAWLIRTYHEKSLLISMLESNLNNLLDKVETINRRYDSDTPQNDAPDEDSHVSYYSRNVNSTDYTTLIERIKEVKDKIFDIYDEWCDEFVRDFIIMSV